MSSSSRAGLIMFIVISLILLFSLITVQQDVTPNLPTENVVRVMGKNSYGGSWQGTGIFIKDDLILTAGHVVDDANEIKVVWANGKEHSAVNWYRETKADIGFVYIRTIKKEPTVGFDNAETGETVWALGNPFAVFPVLTKGIISAINMPDDYWHQKNMIITDTAINPGNSGCPLFNKDGNILGICSWGYIGSQGMNYFIRAEVCKLSLDKYESIKALKEIK